MRNLVIPLIFLIIVFCSCKKDANGTENKVHCINVYLTPEIKNFKFKKGTYWVYIDSVSLITDTMKIEAILDDGMTDAALCYKSLEHYSFRVNNGFYKNVYSLQSNRLMLNQYDLIGNGTEIYIDSSPKIDSLFIYDRYYKSVVSYTHTNEPSENNNKTVFYTNASFGFLKKEVYNSSNQLISAKLLKDKVIVR